MWGEGRNESTWTLYKCIPQAVQHAYRLIIDVQAYYGSIYLGGLGESHHRYFGLHQRGRQACGRGQLATFYGRYPNQDQWQGTLVGVSS